MYTWQVPPSNVSSLSWRMTPPYSLNKCRPTYQRPVIVAIILIILYWMLVLLIVRPAANVVSNNVCKEPVVGDITVTKRIVADDYTLAVRKAIKRIKKNQDSLNPNVVTPFVSVNGIHRIAPKYNLAACINEKVMCTLTQAIFCYLYDSECFVSNKKNITKETWNGRFCENRNEFIGAKEKQRSVPHNHLTVFMVRDPVEKFLSAYSNKCLLEDAQGETSCFNCRNGDVLCAVERFHDEIMRYASKSSFSQNNFNNFINLHFWPRTFSTLASHALPSIWRCEIFEEYKNYFFVRYGETPEEENEMWKTIFGLFRDHGVEEEKLHYINKAVSRRSALATKHRKERTEIAKKLRNSRKHMHLLREVYYYDSIIFDYPLP